MAPVSPLNRQITQNFVGPKAHPVKEGQVSNPVLDLGRPDLDLYPEGPDLEGPELEELEEEDLEEEDLELSLIHISEPTRPY